MVSSASKYYNQDLQTFLKQIVPYSEKDYYILLPNILSEIEDVQYFVGNLKKKCSNNSRVVVTYFNFLWRPILTLASALGLRKNITKEPNWLTTEDIENIFELEGFEEIKKGKRFIFPYPLGLISTLFNKYLSQLPIINSFCLTTFLVFRKPVPKKDFSVSIVIPARNEEKNMVGIINKIPQLGTKTEIIFVEGHSKDNTYNQIKKEIKNNKTRIRAKLFKQKGKGKGDAVRLGFSKAKNEILMILDADLTVAPKDLKKFYDALRNGACEFANGSRLVYPMEKQAMRVLNYFGNSVFRILFTFLLGQKIKDTLCGTKALFRKDYLKIVKGRKFFGDFDPFGDFDLLFGASKLNLKIRDIPVRYKERVYGKTNINRFQNGWVLMKMTVIAAKKIKFV